jgi:type II secretory pathway component PulC
MNKQKAITWSLLILLIALLWDFGNRAILYSPLTLTQDITRPPIPERQNNGKVAEPAWGPEIVNRNLFSKSRSVRVSTPAPAPTKKPSPSMIEQKKEVRPEFTLSGIIQNQSGEDIAYIIFNGQNPIGIRVGEELGGAKLTRIDKRSVTMNWRGSEIKLSLSSQPLIKRR